MNSSCLLLAGALCAGAGIAPVRAAVERVVEKSFPVAEGGTVEVQTRGGSIRVDCGAGNTVKVIARERIEADSDAAADELLKKLTLNILQEDGRVTATAEYERDLGFHWGSWPPVRVDFVVTVPIRFAAVLRTSGGGIQVGDLDGSVDARTSGGNERFGRIGGDIDAATSGGSITLGSGGGKISLATSGGNIEVGAAAGPAQLRTSGGGIRVGAAAGTVSARTSGGDVNVIFTGPLMGDCTLSTSGGRVRASVPKGIGFRLDAATSGGSVSAAGLPIAVERAAPRRNRLEGAVEGGGPELRLRTSGGDIEIAGGEYEPGPGPGPAQL